MFTKIHESNGRNLNDVMIESGHNFEVVKEPLYLPNGKRVPDKMATIRTDNGRYLGTVGVGYQPVQPTKFYGSPCPPADTLHIIHHICIVF